MANWRVVVTGDSGDGFCFRLEDISTQEGYQFVGYGCVHGIEGPLVSHGGVEELRVTLMEMLKALDRPVLRHSQSLEEWA